MMKKYLGVGVAIVIGVGGGVLAANVDSAKPKKRKVSEAKKTETTDAAKTTDSKRAAVGKGIVIEWASGFENTLFNIQIRNTGTVPVNLKKFDLKLDNGTLLAEDGLELVRGSFELCPGDKAMIIAHPWVDPNDQARRIYDNLYRAVKPTGNHIVLGAGGMSLVDGKGAVVGRVDPSIMTTGGKCCRPASSAQACWCPFQGCDGTDIYCIAQTNHSACCKAGNGCCFEPGEFEDCGGAYGCAGWNCIPCSLLCCSP